MIKNNIGPYNSIYCLIYYLSLGDALTKSPNFCVNNAWSMDGPEIIIATRSLQPTLSLLNELDLTNILLPLLQLQTTFLL
jgi:hypothetical protein